jgi:fucose permease
MSAPIQRHDEPAFRLLHAGAFVALFVVGVYAAAFGPALEFIADDLDVSLDTAGLLLTAFFLGSISASAAVAVALHARDTRVLTIAGLIAVIFGSLMIGFAPSWPVALAGGIVMGVGDGLIVAALHILMTLTSRDVPRAINRINLYFAFGAVAGPLWSGAVLALTDERAIAYAGIAAAASVALAMLLTASAPLQQRIAEERPFRLPGHPTAWIMGAVLFLYVGAEFGLGSWVSAYARESADSGVFEAALLTSGYWAALMCGRIASSVYYARQRHALPLLAVSIAGAGVASLALALTTGNIAASALAAFAAGLFLGPVWPSTMAIASEGNEAHATATTVTMGNAGGVVLPWLQGRILVDAGPAEGVVVSVALCAVMLAIVGLFRLRRVARRIA